MAASALRGSSTLLHLGGSLVLIAIGLALLLWPQVEPRAAPAQENAPQPPQETAEQPAPEPQRPAVLFDPGSAMDAHRDLIRLCLYQADAVIVDMQLLRYMDEAPGAEAVRHAADRLTTLEGQLDGAEVPDAMAQATSLLRRALAGLRASVRDEREPGAAPEGMDDVWERLGSEMARFQLAPKNLPEDLSEPMPQFDAEDLGQYKEALTAIEAGDSAGAYAILRPLGERHPDDAFVMLRRADCLAHVRLGQSEPIGETGDPEAEALELLDGLIETEGYHPLLFEIWLKWRTLTQSHRHGASNYSEIANWDYNERRWRSVRLVQGRLESHPGDAWALVQKELLLGIPNVRRGGTMGNTNLGWWGTLFAGDIVSGVLKDLETTTQPDEP